MGFPVGGTGVGGSPVPPGINEAQTSAFNEAMKNVIGMMPFDTSVIVPFTQQEYDQVFHYRSEPDRPMLHPLLHLRASVALEEQEDGSFQAIYQELLNQLPAEIKEWLSDEMRQPFSERDPDAVALHQTLSACATAIGWLAAVTAPIEPNSPQAAYLMINTVLPFVALKGSLVQTAFVLDQAMNALHTAGPNHPRYDTFNGLFASTKEAILEALATQREIEKGLITQDLKSRLALSAHLLYEIADRFKETSAANEFLIMGAELHAMATATAALGLRYGTPSLVLGSSLALTGLNEKESALGPLGSGLDQTMDSVMEGTLGSLIEGPRAEIDELTSLYHQLAALRDEE